jgi:hypothetical protein
MAFPSQILGSGNAPAASIAIAGEVTAAVTAAGTTAADATVVSTPNVRVSTAGASTGIRVPPAETGALMFIRNDGANTVTVYPATGGTINGGASTTIAAAKSVLLLGTGSTAWVSLAGA